MCCGRRTTGTAGSGIFNGDVGVIQDIDSSGELIVLRFDDRTATYTADLLSQLDMAYAITVHKSQGSEYPAVILVSAPAAPSLMVRGVLYTAITRAVVCSSWWVTTPSPPRWLPMTASSAVTAACAAD